MTDTTTHFSPQQPTVDQSNTPPLPQEPTQQKLTHHKKKLPLKLIIGALLLLLLFVGSVSVLFLSQFNQDLRQQASGGVYSGSGKKLACNSTCSTNADCQSGYCHTYSGNVKACKNQQCVDDSDCTCSMSCPGIPNCPSSLLATPLNSCDDTCHKLGSTRCMVNGLPHCGSFVGTVSWSSGTSNCRGDGGAILSGWYYNDLPLDGIQFVVKKCITNYDSESCNNYELVGTYDKISEVEFDIESGTRIFLSVVAEAPSLGIHSNTAIENKGCK